MSQGRRPTGAQPSVTSLVETGRRTLAVITGASSGIGAEFARQLAAAGHDLLLVARRTDRLQKLSMQLEAGHRISCHSLTLDLADPDASTRICEEVGRIGAPVEWLVNNAGYGLIGRLDAFSSSDHQRFVQVLGLSPVETSLALLPELRRAAPSHIVNVASLAAFLPGVPGAGLYPGVKGFLLRFTEVLAAEERAHGVSVTASCPGLTDTEIFDAQQGERPAGIKKMRPMKVDDVVREAIEASRRGDVSIVHGWTNKLAAWLFRHMSPHLARSMVARAYGSG